MSPANAAPEFLLHRGQLLPAAGFTLPHSSRAALYGDGFFETLVWSGGRVRYREYHLARLHRAAAVLRLQLPPELLSVESVTELAARLTAANQLDQARLRLQCWRRGAGLYLPETNAADYLLTAAPLRLSEAPVPTAGFARQVRTLAGPLAFCKGPQAWLYVLAAQERQARGLGELLLLDARGCVAEAVAAAVFWLKGNDLYTPALSTGCVAGVRRAHLLAVARAHGLACHEGAFEPAAVLAADAVFTANVAGIRAIEQLDGVVLGSSGHPGLAALRRWEAVD
ncbi:aminotransferase class IV [Hymenobacter sp. B81]|uniref:aminotransferase class IV n=1 Tax=Hymenobacter sp. B81 TaxID=3344878 RepID=UPI0037DDAD52